jgi:uncharacterized protein YqeY
LLGYLPQQLSEEEISGIVRQAVDEVGAGNIADMEKVMAIVIPEIEGIVDGRLVSQIVK